MITIPHRLLPLAVLASLLVTVLLLQNLGFRDSLRGLPQTVGLGEVVADHKPGDSGTAAAADESVKFNFHPGVPKPHGSNYSRMLVVPRMTAEDVSWIEAELPEIQAAIYVADDPSAPLHPPKNKGHEVMIYLTYIIDHYEHLPDVMIFMHAHRWSWHNDDVLDNDAVQMIRHLSNERVMREGYMNMRCHWDPGCPDWMHPGRTKQDITKQEETMMAKAWSELFPLDPVPTVLAQPCCAQFALSRERVQTMPKSRYIYYRDWLLRTTLSDYISGRVWEYIWQYVFTGENIYCPLQHACYCDGFGVCFGNEDNFHHWFELRYQLRQLERQLMKWQEKARMIEEAKEEGRLDEMTLLEVPEAGQDVFLEEQIAAAKDELFRQKTEALKRGGDPKVRAEESGREWKEGDGF